MEHHLSIWNIQYMHVYTKTPGMCRTFHLQSLPAWSWIFAELYPALSSCVLYPNTCVFFGGRKTQLSSTDFGGIHIISGTHQKKPWHTSDAQNSQWRLRIYRKREGCYNAAKVKSKLRNKLVDNYNSSTEHLWDFVRRFFSAFPVWNNAELVRMIFEFFLPLSLTLSEISSKVEAVKVIVWVLGKLETSCGRHH